MAEPRDYYEVLEVPRDADDATIKKAYRKLAMQYHPDRQPGDASPQAKFTEASEAYSVLRDDPKRATFHRFCHPGLPGPGPGRRPGSPSAHATASSADRSTPSANC